MTESISAQRNSRRHDKLSRGCLLREFLSFSPLHSRRRRLAQCAPVAAIRAARAEMEDGPGR